MMQDKSPLYHAEPTSDLMHWQGWIMGPQDTAYAGQKYILSIVLGEGYPFCPPSVNFLTPIFHPNVSGDGRICLDVLSGMWNSTMTMAGTLMSVYTLLIEPNPDSPLNSEAARLYRGSSREYKERVLSVYSRANKLKKDNA